MNVPIPPVRAVAGGLEQLAPWSRDDALHLNVYWRSPEPCAVRQWARQHGHLIGDTGPLNRAVVDAYLCAHRRGSR
jgi:hypothetical protein